MLGSPKYDHGSDEIEINAGRPTVTLRVTNTGDRGIQVGSHFHFFEVNRALLFERELAYGMHLDIPAGTGVRIEPGDTKEVVLTAYAGARRIWGFNNLVNGGLDATHTRTKALKRMREEGFSDGKPTSRKGGSSESGKAKKGGK
ncbi:urease subunit beta [Nocardioides jishulii]|uniref:Urease subunit beta n=1 Tax=Nocardioides jishulii TaxID=2575440 RepID=A0A4U2YNR2_9ACTN|nr:urease subunit beta [Nocardioides jishulii]TKI62630.1 urease subunit beta [Nocardioides jishulii]